MLSVVLTAGVLVAITVAVHAAGFGLMLRFFMNPHVPPPAQPLAITWLLIRVTWTLILIHLVEIAVWASFYLFTESHPDAEAAFYFSGVTYTALGFGDLLLEEPWRLLAPIEALTGTIMCALSAGLFFALVNRIVSAKPSPSQG
ncbi:MAG: two pore domain potassium channel family protein [Myxococcales bacterium]|nr:MAG: two pore domain potassium channel family protein [Myxococcales bacterium]